MNITNIKNVAAIITGGASGMGAETAKLLVSKGVKVTILDINEQAGQSMAKTLGHETIAMACDVSSPESVATALAEAEKVHGIPRIGVNCAGICPAQRMVSKQGVMPLAEFRRVIDSNLIGTFNVMSQVTARMMSLDPLSNDGERGVIINTASIAAYEGQIGQTAYSAAKGGIVALTLPAARELASSGIRVMTIAPGIMETPMLTNMPQAVQESLSAMIPFPRRMGNPNEYARLVLHIIENSYLNAEVIRLDGAIRMREK